MIDLHTARGIALLVCCIVMTISSVSLIYNLIHLVIINRQIRKLEQALKELDTTPLDEWEAKWAEFVNKGYEKLNDPNHDEVVADMQYFKEIREELNKED